MRAKTILLFVATIFSYNFSNASTLRTDMGGSLREKESLKIIDVSVLSRPTARLELFAKNKKEQGWKCIVSSEVAQQAGYTLGQLQMILLSDADVVLYCNPPDENSMNAANISVIGHAK